MEKINIDKGPPTLFLNSKSMKYSRKVRNSQKQAIVGKKKFYVVKFDSFYPATKQLHCNINYKGFKKAYQRSV